MMQRNHDMISYARIFISLITDIDKNQYANISSQTNDHKRSSSEKKLICSAPRELD